MGSFTLGGGSAKQSSQSTSESDSYGYSGSTSEQSSLSSASSSSLGTSQSGQQIAFEDLIGSLYKNASAATGSAAMAAPELTNLSRSLFKGGLDIMGNLGQNAGTSYLESRLSGENPVLEEQIGALREDTGRLFSEELLPGITSRAVAGGTLGGGRQGVAQAGAARNAAEVFTRGATALRSADVTQRDAAATSLLTGANDSSAIGLGALGNVFDVAQRGANAELAPYSALSAIIGGPTVLTESTSRNESSSISNAISQALAEAFGEQFSTSRAQSSSRGKSWNFNTGASFGNIGGG